MSGLPADSDRFRPFEGIRKICKLQCRDIPAQRKILESNVIRIKSRPFFRNGSHSDMRWTQKRNRKRKSRYHDAVACFQSIWLAWLDNRGQKTRWNSDLSQSKPTKCSIRGTVSWPFIQPVYQLYHRRSEFWISPSMRTSRWTEIWKRMEKASTLCLPKVSQNIYRGNHTRFWFWTVTSLGIIAYLFVRKRRYRFGSPARRTVPQYGKDLVHTLIQSCLPIIEKGLRPYI